MARKPKTQPSPDTAAPVPMLEPATPDEAAIPACRGRKPKDAALLSAPPSTASTDGAEADVPTAAPTKAPGRRGAGRKAKQAVGAETAAAVQDEVAGPQGQAPGRPEAEASPGLTEAGAPAAAAVLQAEAAADSDPVQPDRDPVSSAGEAARSAPDAETSLSAKPAAHWDRRADLVRFDWPAIEQTAAQDGLNQAMAKLLLAARAEGARSRWPF